MNVNRRIGNERDKRRGSVRRNGNGSRNARELMRESDRIVRGNSRGRIDLSTIILDLDVGFVSFSTNECISYAWAMMKLLF